MPYVSKKAPNEPKNINIEFDGPLHARLKKMADAERRSLKAQLLTIVEQTVTAWERSENPQSGTQEGSVPRRASVLAVVVLGAALLGQQAPALSRAETGPLLVDRMSSGYALYDARRKKLHIVKAA